MVFPYPRYLGFLFAFMMLAKLSFASATDSAYELGLMAYSKQNYDTAIVLFLQAAEQNEPGADYMLMRLYGDGLGLKPNKQASFKWARRAANNGVAQAQYIVAGFFFSGIGTDINYKQAAYWYRQAANNGHHLAYYKLAEMHDNGIGIEKNQQQARRLYTIAAGEMNVFAQKGELSAQNELAWMYEHGLGVRKNLVHAKKWYLKAALTGYAEAQYNLARVLNNSDVVTGSKAQAIYWLEQAARQGFKKAKLLLTRLQPSKFQSSKELALK